MNISQLSPAAIITAVALLAIYLIGRKVLARIHRKVSASIHAGHHTLSVLIMLGGLLVTALSACTAAWAHLYWIGIGALATGAFGLVFCMIFEKSDHPRH